MSGRPWAVLLIIFSLTLAPVPAEAGAFSCFLQALKALIKKTFLPATRKTIVELLPLEEENGVHKTDEYDPVGLIPMGKWKGEAINTTYQRPARIIYEDDQKILFANFRDGEKFHLAHVPKDGVESVYFRINRFPGPIKSIVPAHTLLYFRMKPGHEVILEAGGNVQDLSHPHAVSDFVFSTDYVAPPGVTYDFFGGLSPNFLTVMNFSSAYDYSLRGSDPNFAVEYLKLNLTDDQKNALLQAAIHRSDERGVNYAYDLFKYNCTTALFELMDDTLTYEEPVKPYKVKLRKMKDAVAGPSEEGLVKRGVVAVDEKGKLPALWADPRGGLPSL